MPSLSLMHSRAGYASRIVLSPGRLSLDNKLSAGPPAGGVVVSLFRSPGKGERSSLVNEVLLSASEARQLGQLLVEAVADQVEHIADQVEASSGETGPAPSLPGPALKPKAPSRREVELREAEARRAALNRSRFDAAWASGAPSARRPSGRS